MFTMKVFKLKFVSDLGVCTSSLCLEDLSSTLLIYLFISRNTKDNLDNQQALLPTQFGMSTTMLAAILCVKESALNMPFEMKVNNILFVGYPKKVGGAFLSLILIDRVVSSLIDPLFRFGEILFLFSLSLSLSLSVSLSRYYPNCVSEFRW